MVRTLGTGLVAGVAAVSPAASRLQPAPSSTASGNAIRNRSWSRDWVGKQRMAALTGDRGPRV